MALPILLLTAFMTGWCQAHELTHASSATKTAGIADLGTIDHRRDEPNAMFLGQFLDDRFVSGLLGQLADRFFHPFNLSFKETQLSQETPQCRSRPISQPVGFSEGFQPPPIPNGPADSTTRWLFKAVSLDQHLDLCFELRLFFY